MHAYPFTAIVGQEPMRLALLLNAVDPAIGGVLIRGEKGTAKSTMARSLAALLPDQAVVEGCPFRCAPPDLCAEHAARAARGEELPLVTRPVPVVELPNNTTEDRLAGTLDIEAALKRGEKRFQPGLLAAANRGILYVDEVNLLPDHLVDLLLDAAAMGVHTVEREGISFQHPARFILFGTMNPEEGELRPQLLDRFGLCVEVTGLREIDARVEVMTRRAAYDADPEAFCAQWRDAERRERERIVAARALLPEVVASPDILRRIAAIALAVGVDGHRADLVMLRTARALAAYEGRREVTADDVRRAAELALPHRLRRLPFDEQRSEQRLRDALSQVDQPPPPSEPSPPDHPDSGSPPSDAPSAPPAASDEPAAAERRAEPGAPIPLPALTLERDRLARSASGRRHPSLSDDRRGRVVRAALPDSPTSDIAVIPTIRAAASHPPAADSPLAVTVTPSDLRRNVRRTTVGVAILFVVDASGSMGARRRMEAAKGAALTLLTDAYQRRDRVGLIAFRAKGAEVLLPFTDSVETAHARLRELPTGGRTPLAAGLHAALDLIRQQRLRDPALPIVVVLITDGKANVPLETDSPLDEALALAARFAQPGLTTLVLDTENDPISFGLARRLADAAGAQYLRLADISADSVVRSLDAVR
ncbi:MAG: putative cobaltochelatase [Chloroflexota bacterium]|nr:putative cobaltochelatase [Dehalococcoidia bacterium]MDW8252493.1 putative cobaltochelatase [Chloroflexota bacterium]